MTRLATSLTCCLTLAAGLVAPGAAADWKQGAGAQATGGAGGDVYRVTTLADDGPGSLRHGIATADGPRTILFDVAGTIRLAEDLRIDKPDLTLAGQTAPGGGVTLADRQVRIADTHNIIVQFLRFRPGDTYSRPADSDYEPDALWVSKSQNILIDHVSTSWGVDETLSVSHGSDDVTVQWSIIAQALRNAGHHKGEHGYGSIIDGHDLTFHHNLFADNDSRNARIGGKNTVAGFINNVIVNPGIYYGYSADPRPPGRSNLIGNVGIDGADTTAGPLFVGGEGTRVYARGNVMDRDRDGELELVASSNADTVGGPYIPEAEPLTASGGRGERCAAGLHPSAQPRRGVGAP